MRKVEKITLTNYEQNGQSMLVTVSEFSLETKLIRVSKIFESKKKFRNEASARADKRLRFRE